MTYRFPLKDVFKASCEVEMEARSARGYVEGAAFERILAEQKIYEAETEERKAFCTAVWMLLIHPAKFTKPIVTIESSEILRRREIDHGDDLVPF